MLSNRHNQYIVALILPALVTLLALLPRGMVPAENIALVYIVAVIVTAVNTGTRPAMLAAFVSFITFNFFFTEPRHTLLVLHPPDVLTISIFLLTAVLVGHLAARLRERVEQLQNREHFSNIELIFMEKLAGAIDAKQVLTALDEALQHISGLQYELLTTKDAIQAQEQERPGTAAAIDASATRFPTRELTDGEDIVAILKTQSDAEARDQNDSIQLLVHQANLALGRTRLVADLQHEKLGKEQETLRSSLLSSVSHDFRTPLTSMIGAASTLQEMRDSLSPAQQKELLDSILSEASRLDGYTQKLLDMTRLGYGELKLHRSTVSLKEILNVIKKRFRHAGKEDRLKLEVASTLPLLNVHAALIEQALYNVIENALKFSPTDAFVSVRGFTEDSQLVIEIEDSGPGIPLEEREKVFEMFHSADRGDRRVAGSGLGLAICKGMIGAHGGVVEIRDPTTGSGCVVVIRLPLPDTGEQSE
ncbi:MAG: DUF4118 domain-containing protein [Proteobacteria bacterium]|nr:DUF4118 domain-containing protein [Pseudomonadota bacterium]